MAPRLLQKILFAISIQSLVWALVLRADAAADKTGLPPDGLLIKYRETVSDADLERTFKNGHLRYREYVRTGPMLARGQLGLVRAQSDLPTQRALDVLRKDPCIEYAEPNYRVSRQFESDDPRFTDNELWGVDSSSFSTRALAAWAAGFIGSPFVHVAVIDDGAQFDHQDLAANIWANPFETPGDNVDNDGNGFIDDVNGWNFVGEIEDETNVPYDPADAHGTLVSGVIGAVGGNGIGSVGVNWNVTIIPIRSLADGSGTILDIVEAVDYCIDLKTLHPEIDLVAINASWGSTEYSQFLNDAVIRAAKAGILFIAAAGNGGTDNDVTPFYPANLDTTVGTYNPETQVGETAADYNSVISVTAIDSSGNLATFSSGSSNYGLTKVHLGAPGKDIIGPGPDNLYYSGEGTSLAAPFVTGAVALYRAAFPLAPVEDIRAAILAGAEPTASLAGATSTGGRVDLTFMVPAAVEGRFLFYNNSAWDGNDPGANASDDAAIAPDKSALMPSGTAIFANYSSYSRGINGIMIDISNLGDAGALSASDFAFKVGNSVTPSTWANAPAPSSVSVRVGAGVGGSDRVTIIWADGAIKKQWVEIEILATANTGLTATDRFYFGNAVGESGNSTANARVNLADEIGARNNLTTSATITNVHDHNRDKRVNLADQILARNNLASGGTEILFIQPPL